MYYKLLGKETGESIIFRQIPPVGHQTGWTLCSKDLWKFYQREQKYFMFLKHNFKSNSECIWMSRTFQDWNLITMKKIIFKVMLDKHHTSFYSMNASLRTAVWLRSRRFLGGGGHQVVIKAYFTPENIWNPMHCQGIQRWQDQKQVPFPLPLRPKIFFS